MRKRFDYAVILLGHLKGQAGTFVDIARVAEISGLPKAYLEKVAQEMKHAGWVESRRGPRGGYRLAPARKEISMDTLINFYSPLKEFCPVLRLRK